MGLVIGFPPLSVSFASILPLVRLLLVLIVLGSVIQLPLVLSLGVRNELQQQPVMHASVDGDRGVWYRRRVGRSIGAPPPPRPPYPSQHHHHRCHHQMTHYHNYLLHRQDIQQDPPHGLIFSSLWTLAIVKPGDRVVGEGIGQDEADPSLVPISPHQKISVISLARFNIN
ncbi:hypothetical protein Tco_0327641 [Tanacetum coccineum]